MERRFFAFLIAVVLLLGTLPQGMGLPALAAETDTTCADGHNFVNAGASTIQCVDCSDTIRCNGCSSLYDDAYEVIETEASCTASGTSLGWRCDGCGSWILEETRLIPPMGHSYTDGVCTRCGVQELYSGAWGSNITWTLNPSTGLMTVSGTGAIRFSVEEAYPWTAYKDLIVTLEIGQGITSIGTDAFSGCSSLTSVSIPNSVVGIQDNAFYYCSSLTGVSIPASVTLIGDYAFEGCTSLETVEFSEGLTTVGTCAFYYCGIEEVNLPDSLTWVGFHAFSDCSNLSKVTLGKGLTDLSLGMFERCTRLTSVTIPDAVTTIGQYTFSYCVMLTNITIPASVTEIGSRAFDSCLSLREVHFLGDMPTIASDAFDKNSNIAFPALEKSGGIPAVASTASEGNDYIATFYILEDAEGWTDCAFTTKIWDYSVTYTCCTVTYTCNTCGEIYVDDYEGDHNWEYDPDASTPASCQSSGCAVYVCTFCGEAYEEAEAILPHSYIDGFCTACGATETVEPVEPTEADIKISHSVSFDSDLKMNYRIKYENIASAVPNYVTEGAYLVVEKDQYLASGEFAVDTVTLYPDLESDSTRMLFNLSGIQSVEMGSELRAVLHIFDAEGNEYVTPVDAYSILDYAQLFYDTYTYEQQPELYAMLIDALNYGSAAQIYFGRRADVLVNAGMEAYQQYATTELSAPLEDSKVTETNDRSITAVSKIGFSVTFADKTEMNAKLTIASGYSKSDITSVKVLDAQGNVVDTLTDFTELADGRLQVTYYGVKSVQMRDRFYFVAYVGDQVASDNVGYSVEAYAKSNIASTDANLADMVLKCIYYGDSAYAYFNR